MSKMCPQALEKPEFFKQAVAVKLEDEAVEPGVMIKGLGQRFFALKFS